MGTKYASQASSGYNSSPPADDGSVTDANKGKWATIKTKLADPVKTLADAINTALVSALDVSVTTQSTNYTTLASDHQKPILCTGSITISLRDAGTAAVGYQVTVVNAGTGTITVGLITGTDTLNGTTAGTVKLRVGQSVTVETSAATAYRVISGALNQAQGYVKVDSTGSIGASFNVTSVTDVGTGQIKVNWTTAFASVEYIVMVSVDTGANAYMARVNTQNAADVTLDCVNTSNTLVDPSRWHVVAFGV